MSVRPVFLLSMPRSGSTWVQRMLSTHPEVASAAEPWLLLPQFYLLDRYGGLAEYNHRLCAEAVEDLIGRLPHGRQSYLAALRSFMQELYDGLSPSDATVFLDKTPRYYLIADEIAELFPDARFILLVRNPLAIAASMQKTWGSRTWKAFHYQIDFEKGLPALAAFLQKHADRSLLIKYEDIVEDPAEYVSRIQTFLELSPHALDDVNPNVTEVTGRMGDSSYRVRSASALDGTDSWVDAFSSPIRRRWARQLLARLDRGLLQEFGYDRVEILGCLPRAPTRVSDSLWDLGYPFMSMLYRMPWGSGLKRQVLDPEARRRYRYGLH